MWLRGVHQALQAKVGLLHQTNQVKTASFGIPSKSSLTNHPALYTQKYFLSSALTGEFQRSNFEIGHDRSVPNCLVFTVCKLLRVIRSSNLRTSACQRHSRSREHSKQTWFKSRPENRLSWLRVFISSSVTPTEFWHGAGPCELTATAVSFHALYSSLFRIKHLQGER